MENEDAENRPLVLRGGRVVLPGGMTGGASLLVEDGRIAKILTNDDDHTVDGAVVLELDGAMLLPGFIDVHIHGSVGVDTMEAGADDLHRVARFLAAEGVTAWLPTLVPAPDEDYRRATAAIERLMREQDGTRPAAAARAVGVHYEGPFVNRAQCGALRPAYFRTYAAHADIHALANIELDDAVHMITVAPEIVGGIELVRELVARGWVVSIGHTRAPIEILERAAEAGARHMTHFFNAMSPLHQRTPGPIGWGLLRDDVTCDVIADGVHCDPLMLRLVLRCKTAACVALISDAVAPAGIGDGEYRLWGETVTVTDGRTRNAAGSIAGSVITMRDAVRMMFALGVPAHDVAQMAATNPARLLRIDRDYGSIEYGKRADLVALDDESRVLLTLVGGRIAFQNDEKLRRVR